MSARTPNRSRLHAHAVAWVATQLRQLGCVVDVLPPSEAHGLSMRVAAPGRPTPLAIAVRSAARGLRRVRVRIAGKCYRYAYPIRHYNLHCHGQRQVHPDVWVLMALDDPAASLIVPGTLLPTRKSLAAAVDAERPGRWAQWTLRWDVIVGGDRKAA